MLFRSRFSSDKEVALYRIVQEMLNNALKYANASKIEVQLLNKEGRLELFVSDDGKGFDMEEVKRQTPSDHGFGLKNIESRADMINAKMELNSAEGKGTNMLITMDLNK